jgi:hypothetical protein
VLCYAVGWTTEATEEYEFDLRQLQTLQRFFSPTIHVGCGSPRVPGAFTSGKEPDEANLHLVLKDKVSYICTPVRLHDVVINLYFHSVMSYGLIFWGNSAFAEKVFRM